MASTCSNAGEPKLTLFFTASTILVWAILLVREQSEQVSSCF